MARGGYRPGAGRPKGAKSSKAKPKTAPQTKSVPKGKSKKRSQRKDKSPLEYMLRVMNDPAADPSRRDRMAIAAAPFLHARGAEGAIKRSPGKKEEAAIAAIGAAENTGWKGLVH